MRTMLKGTRPTVPGLMQQRRSASGLPERERKSAFKAYGGFGERRSSFAPGDPEGIFARKRSLIAATGSTAPIERSKLNRGFLGTVRFPIAQTRFQASTPDVPEALQQDQVDSPPKSLDEFLASESRVLHDRARSEGWKHFQANDYRSAIRAFGSAAMLDESDFESRIGQVFSYVALGSFRAAILSLDEIARRDLNIFDHDLAMPDRFDSSTHAQQIRLMAQGMAEASEQGSEIKALSIYVLWFLDAKDDAMRAAKSLADKEPRTANWPKLMQAAKSRMDKASP